MNNNTTFAVIAIVAALGLLGVVIVDSILSAAQVASAVPPPTKGCRNSLAAQRVSGKLFSWLAQAKTPIFFIFKK
jgi:hypothetical protein